MFKNIQIHPALAFAGSLLLLASTALATPTAMNFSGRLSDGAGAISGPVEITFTLYDNADTADGVQWSETLEIIVDGGLFNVFLGGDPGNLIPASTYGLPELFVGIQVETEAEMSPRIQLASVPYAIRAAEAETLSGTAAAGFAKSDQSCSPGDKVTGFGPNGEILCAADVDTNSTYSGANFATSSQACGGTQKVTGINGSGGVTCGNDIDTDTNTDSNTNASTQCNGQYTFLNGDGGCVGQQALATGSNPTFAGVNAGGSKVTNVGAPTGNSDAATKSYVDAAAGGGGGLDIVLTTCVAEQYMTPPDNSTSGPSSVKYLECQATCPNGYKVLNAWAMCSTTWYANAPGGESEYCFKKIASTSWQNAQYVDFSKRIFATNIHKIEGSLYCVKSN